MTIDYALQTSQIIDGKLIFDTGDAGFKQALHDGFFFLKMPEAFNLEPGDTFANYFYKDKSTEPYFSEYTGFRQYTTEQLGEHEGYYCRESDQTEQFFLEKRFWAQLYPTPLAQQAQYMADLSVLMLRDILSYLEVPQHLWSKATGGCAENMGMYHLTFNHFRPQKQARGLNTHKDSGWITVLRSVTPGLEAYIDERWVAVPPKPGYFTINFGCAFEILTKYTAYPVTAVTHRVVQQYADGAISDRFSYALFADISIEDKEATPLYEFKDGQLHEKMNFKKFLDNIVHDTYQQDTVGLY